MTTELQSSRAFVSWSGGKDCCLSLYYALKNKINIQYLLSIFDHTGRIGVHSLAPDIVEMQARAIGIPLIQRRVTVANYDREFVSLLSKLKREGVDGGVFGDINDGNGHAKVDGGWIERVCRTANVKPYLPLWSKTKEEIFRELIDLGFEVVIIRADNDKLGKKLLGRKVDSELLAEFKHRYEQSPTGEVGYYHTLAIDGPIFKRRLEILHADKVLKEDEWGSNWSLDIKECQLK
jgi:uncharacterized protein (TIGR00290 family)